MGSKEFHDYVMHDVLGEIPGLTSRAMFGGYGIYEHGIIFAIIADGQLYFKANKETESEYKKYGSKPFTYKMPNKKLMTMSYWLLPEEIMENREEIFLWVKKAVAVSRADKKPKKR